jgi:hypothetical protein
MMQQYSLFTHGNALAIETPQNLAFHIRVGWGTQIRFKEPVPENTPFGTVFADQGPGSWFHMPLTSTLNTFGRANPQLDSITLLFETSHCRITNVHVYDGVEIVEQFNNLGQFGLHGAFLEARNSKDVNPEVALASPQSFSNTFKLKRPHRVFSAIGVSFFACAFAHDFIPAQGERFDGPFPASILTVSAAGAQFLVDDSSLFTLSIGEAVKIGKSILSIDP